MLKIYLDRAGVEHFALVTEEHADGTVDIAIVKPNYVNVPRSATPEPGTVYDPTFVATAPDAPPAPTGLTSVPPELAGDVTINDDGSQITPKAE